MPGLLRALRLLGDPARVRLLLLLERDELSVAELQEILTRGQSQISTQLAQLKQAGLVEHRRTGKNTFYRMKAPSGRLLDLLHAAAEEIPECKSDRGALELVLAKRQDRMRAYFDALAGKFGREYLPGRSWKGLAEVLLQLMPSMVIADLGAGEGTFSQLLARSANRVIAVDNAEKMVEFGTRLAREHNLPNLEFRLGDMEALPIEDSEVDLAFFSQSLHHAQHPERAVAEAGRILKPGGRIAILDLARHTFEQARELYADVWLGFSEVELRAFLSDAGFTDVTTSIVDREPEPPYFETVCGVARKLQG
ncbi:MAG TPA: metalloregulator ArsR/SmtB family transcription factor [Bryobacteraceae bacterium]|nr:metalloregulator ArsR/SmtB family transcription factor [Bryobacteraceae bacterium]